MVLLIKHTIRFVGSTQKSIFPFHADTLIYHTTLDRYAIIVFDLPTQNSIWANKFNSAYQVLFKYIPSKFYIYTQILYNLIFI